MPDAGLTFNQFLIVGEDPLAFMHGSSYHGDGAKALYDLAAGYQSHYLTAT